MFFLDIMLNKWLNSMVYGRYNELANGVCKPTYNWGAPSCTKTIL